MPDSGTYYAVTGDAGGYAIPITESGTYTVTFSGGDLASPVQRTVLVGAASVLLDPFYVPEPELPLAQAFALGSVLLVGRALGKLCLLGRSHARPSSPTARHCADLPVRLVCTLAALGVAGARPAAAQTPFVAFETGQVRPLALTPDGNTLLGERPVRPGREPRGRGCLH